MKHHEIVPLSYTYCPVEIEYTRCKYETGTFLFLENTRLLHENDKKYFIRSIAHR